MLTVNNQVSILTRACEQPSAHSERFSVNNQVSVQNAHLVVHTSVQNAHLVVHTSVQNAHLVVHTSVQNAHLVVHTSVQNAHLVVHTSVQNAHLVVHTSVQNAHLVVHTSVQNAHLVVHTSVQNAHLVVHTSSDGEVKKGVIGPEAIHHAQPNIATFATEAYFPVLITHCQTNLATVANRGRELDNLVIYMMHQAIWSGRKRRLERDRKERHLVSTCAGHPKVTNKAINTTLQKLSIRQGNS